MCPSEVSDVEFSLWRRYQAEGLVVWGVGSEDDLETLRRFRDQMGITFPILHDPGTLVLDTYGQLRHQFGIECVQNFGSMQLQYPDGAFGFHNQRFGDGFGHTAEDTLPPRVVVF